MFRWILAGGLSLLALLIIALALMLDPHASLTDLLFNLGAEVIGIAITVAIVDWLFQRNKLRDAAQSMAWRVLHEIDQAVWVWQGGRREFHLDELVALIDLIDEHDTPTETTEDLFANLGRMAADSLRLHGSTIKHDKHLAEALNRLTGLAQIKVLKGKMPRTYLVDALRRAVEALARATGQAVHSGSFGVAKTFRNGSRQAQLERFQGWRYGGLRPMQENGTAQSDATM